MMSRPFQLFIGSSSEGRAIATSLIDALKNENHYFTVVPWWDAFPSNDSFLDALISSSKAVDFAIFIATPDDIRVMRGEEKKVPRDNVLFEFALYCGQLGKKKVVLVLCESGNVPALSLPTDLSGITNIRFHFENGDYYDLANRCQVELLRDGAREGAKEILGDIERRIRTRDDLGKHVFKCHQQIIADSLSAPPQTSIVNALEIFEKARVKDVNGKGLPDGFDPPFFDFANLTPEESKKLSSQLSLRIFQAAKVRCRHAMCATKVAIWDGAQPSNKRVLFDAVSLSGLPAIIVDNNNKQILGRYCRKEKVVLAHDFLKTGFTPIGCVRLLRESGLIVNDMVTLCAKEELLSNALSEAKTANLNVSYCFSTFAERGVRAFSGETLRGRV